MLETIKNIFVGIADFLTSIISFVIGFIEDLVYIIKLTGEMVLNIPKYFSWLPEEVIAIIVIIFGVVVIYKVLGREG